jgi:hypothetical protein
MPTSTRMRDASAMLFITFAAFPSLNQMPMSGCGWTSPPGPEGIAGQVITNVTECDFIVLAPTFHAFLARYLEFLGTGICFYEAETYGYVIPQNLEALHTGAVRQDDFYRRLFPLTARYRLRYFFDAGSGVCL